MNTKIEEGNYRYVVLKVHASDTTAPHKNIPRDVSDAVPYTHMHSTKGVHMFSSADGKEKKEHSRKEKEETVNGKERGGERDLAILHSGHFLSGH